MNSTKILIADDAQQVRRVLRTALSAEGYTVFEAGTGEEALNLFRTSPPDAILSFTSKIRSAGTGRRGFTQVNRLA